ncbi:cellulose synthase-like protein D5 [Tanacetum coccineum]
MLCPVNTVLLHIIVLKERLEPTVNNPKGLSNLPGINILFQLSTADAEKDPPLITANTIISILAVDNPTDKAACYLSDDGGSLITFESLAKAASFAKHRLETIFSFLFCPLLIDIAAKGCLFPAFSAKDPPLITANTILSILAVDNPADKAECYLSDDGGSLITFEALAKAASFAKHRLETKDPPLILPTRSLNLAVVNTVINGRSVIYQRIGGSIDHI